MKVLVADLLLRVGIGLAHQNSRCVLARQVDRLSDSKLIMAEQGTEHLCKEQSVLFSAC